MTWIDERVAPGRLELIRAFVNTTDLARGPESLQQPSDAQRWLVERALTSPELEVDEAGFQRVLALREALRALLLRNGGGADAPKAIALVNEIAACSGLAPRLTTDGSARLSGTADGLDGALGALAAVLFEAIAAGTWSRLRACADPGCQWAFYDGSRNRSSRWCDMGICGNRAKQRAFSQRRRERP